MKNTQVYIGNLEILERLNNSRNGNPNFRIRVGGQIARTVSDAAYAYELQNFEGKPVKAWIGTHYGKDALDSIESISPDECYKRVILDGIDNSNYSDKELSTNAEKIAFLHATFQAEYGWAIERYGMQGALREWLQGLPSAIAIPFYNFDILHLAVDCGNLKRNASEKDQEKILNNYWNYMAAKILQLFEGYHVPKA